MMHANSAVTLPRSPRHESKICRERTANEIGEHTADLVAPQDYDEQPRESNCGHGRDCVLGCRSPIFTPEALEKASESSRSRRRTRAVAAGTFLDGSLHMI
jgi:hypothetical protein